MGQRCATVAAENLGSFAALTRCAQQFSPLGQDGGLLAYRGKVIQLNKLSGGGDSLWELEVGNICCHYIRRET